MKSADRKSDKKVNNKSWGLDHIIKLPLWNIFTDFQF